MNILRHLPSQRLAYVPRSRFVQRLRPDQGSLPTALIGWYRSQGGDLDQTTLYGMSHDDPNITPMELCRFDWCLTIPTGWTSHDSHGDVAIRDFPACDVASVSMTGDADLETRILQYLWARWFPVE